MYKEDITDDDGDDDDDDETVYLRDGLVLTIVLVPLLKQSTSETDLL